MITKELALKIGFLVVAGYVVLCLGVFIGQRRLIYFPSRVDVPLPSGFEIWPSPDSKEIWGYKRVSGARECLFFFHGNGGNASGWSHAVAEFPGDIFVLEYPGYGERLGAPSEHSIKAAAKEAFAKEQARYEKVLVAGESLGAAVTETIFTSWPERIYRLILITPFLSLRDMARDQYWFLPTGWLLRDRMELYGPWQKFSGKTRIVVAGADEIIPRAQTLRYMAATNAQVSVLELPGVGHNGVNLDAEFWKEVLK